MEITSEHMDFFNDHKAIPLAAMSVGKGPLA